MTFKSLTCSTERGKEAFVWRCDKLFRTAVPSQENVEQTAISRNSRLGKKRKNIEKNKQKKQEKIKIKTGKRKKK